MEGVGATGVYPYGNADLIALEEKLAAIVAERLI
jgi:GTPase SAR1 family protein